MVLNHTEMAKMFKQTTEFDGEISPTNFQPDFCEFRPQVLTAIELKLLGPRRFDPLG